MLIFKATEIKSSEITDEFLYRNRRQFLTMGVSALAGAVASAMLGSASLLAVTEGQQLPAKRGPYDVTDTPTPYQAITTYNNYYEFGLDKEMPARNSTKFKTTPWTVNVEGMVKKPIKYALDDLLKGLTAEDRIYRMRCVEGWSMVIPWQGIPLAAIIQKLEPLPSAKFVEFKTILAPEQMIGERLDVLPWPYVEGLRMDEAMNPLRPSSRRESMVSHC